MEELDTSQPVAVDTETYLIQPGDLQPRPVVASFAQGELSCLDYPSNAINILRRRLVAKAPLVGHNVFFDMGVMVKYSPDLMPYVFEGFRNGTIKDTRTRQQIIDLARGHLGKPRFDGTQGYSLAELELHHLGIDRSAEKEGDNIWRLRYAELDGVPLERWPQEASQYALSDAAGTLKVYKAQEAACPLDGELEIARSNWALHLMSCHGIYTDAAKVASLKERCLKARVKDAAALKRAKIFRDDGTKDMARVRAFVSKAFKKARKPVPRTERGAVSTDRDTLEQSGSRVLKALARLSVIDKLLTAFVPALERGTVTPLMPQYGIAETGRTTCSGGKQGLGLNIQQMPRGNPNDPEDPRNFVRECFIPRPGYVFVSVDYDAAELRALAHVCRQLFGFSRLGDALDAGRDPHLDFAAQMLGISYEEAERRKKEPQVKEARQFGKCFHPETEVLTRTGWKRVDTLSLTDEIAAAIPENGAVRIEWQHPTQLTTRESSGELVHLKNEGIDLRVTPDHRTLVYGHNGVPMDVYPEEINHARGWYSAGTLSGGTFSPDERLLRLAVAVQADGSYDAKGGIRFGFSKRRKIDRLRSLLVGFEHKEYAPTAQGVTTFRLAGDLERRIKALLDAKKLPWSWTELTPELRAAVLEEAEYWDSHTRKGAESYGYCSVEKQNVEVLQTLAVLSGRKTRLSLLKEAKDGHRAAYGLTVRSTDRSRSGAVSVKRVPYTGTVYCLSVPSTHVIVRDGGVPVVTSQCFNFGKPGGLGSKTLCEFARITYGVTMTRAQADRLGRVWLRAYPEMEKFFEHCDRLGTKIVVPGYGLVRGGVGFTAACNSQFQGLVAAGARDACFDVSDECYVDRGTALFGSRPVAFIHDELILEVPDDPQRANDAAYRLAEVMCAAMSRRITSVKVTASPVLMRSWQKNAEALFDPEGRLTCAA